MSSIISDLRVKMFVSIIGPLGGRAIRGMGGFPGMNLMYRGLVRYLVPGDIGTVKYDGFVMDIYRRGYPRMLIGDGSKYSPAETNTFKSMIKPGMTVLHIGACEGYYVLASARLVGPEGKIYAFEPFPEAFGLMEKNVARSGFKNIVMINKAVANYTGTTKFYLSDTNPLANSLNKARADMKYIEVPTITLDEFLGDENVDFIRSCAEGSEILILKGMGNVIKNNPHLKMQVEVDPLALDGLGYTLEEYMNTLLENFDVHIIMHRSDTVELYRDMEQISNGLTFKYGGTQMVCISKRVKNEYQ